MNTKADTLITPEQEDKLINTWKEIMNSKYVDPSNPPTAQEMIKSYLKGRGETQKHYKPGTYDFSNPETMYKEYWEQYVSFLALHHKLINTKGTERREKARKSVAKKLAKYLRRTPTATDLKSAFPSLTELDDEICQVIDKDLASLVI